MPPNPEDNTVRKTAETRKFSRVFADSEGDEIVISGMSGKFPQSDNVMEYAENLYSKFDMVDAAQVRWDITHLDIPIRSGKIKEIRKFDATFFGVNPKQAHLLDPQCRLLMEAAYEAVLDSGTSPIALRGSKTGVYVGACISEVELNMLLDEKGEFGFGITGCSRAMFANRVSYCMGCHGPSVTMDTACSSSMTALDTAFSALRNGEIDAALIGGTNLTLHPSVTLQFANLGVLSLDGVCRPFDKNACGYSRSEAVTCIFLQRKRDAKRVYANLVYSKANCDGFKPEGITYPAGYVQERLLRAFYNDVGISMNDIGYMEAHSTGTVVGDPEECRAIDSVIASQRKEPLLVGSVKSNIGHTEPASGVCSIVKVLITFQTGLIPPNINFWEVRPEIPALVEGRIKVVNETTKLTKPYVAVNSFGFGGANAHILLKAPSRTKQNTLSPDDNLPRVVLWSSRVKEGVTDMFAKLESMPLDIDYIALLNNVQSKTIPGFVFRGYDILENKANSNATCISKDFQHFSGITRPVVWVFSGMGSQWAGMGNSLMQIPLFKQSIIRCHNALKPSGLDLVSIITAKDPKTFDKILHSFVGIAAIQIALVDILKALDLQPDFIIGHSVGELGCAYADGAFTPEQMILASYYRGKVSEEAEKIVGSMAAIGLGYQEIKGRLPETIEVACHNASNSSTISGPKEDVEKFVKELTAEGIFAREVPCSNIAYHSRYISHFGPKLLKYLKHIIPNPVRRSAKWLSSSVPHENWDTVDSQISSAEYHTNNLLKSVLFEETCKHLPDNCLTIEVAPHGLLQAILKHSFPNGAHVGLTQRGNVNNKAFFLSSLGRLYMEGLDIAIDRIYPKINWPVSLGTPSISHLIKWEHTENWNTLDLKELMRYNKCEKVYRICLKDEHDHLRGHVIDGKVLVPATFYLVIVWETFAKLHHCQRYHEFPVEFQNIKFLQATTLTDEEVVPLVVVVHYATGEFEITHERNLVVSGKITAIEKEVPPAKIRLESTSFPTVSKKDFYKELKLRGYHYAGEFRGVEEARGDGTYGKVEWTGNWVSFMDCLLQTSIIGKDSRLLYLPTRVRKLRILSKLHLQLMSEIQGDKKLVEMFSSEKANRAIAGGIELYGFHGTAVSRRRVPGIPVLERHQFVPHAPKSQLRTADAARICTQLALENRPKLRLKIVEHLTSAEEPIVNLFLESIEDLPNITGDFILLSPKEFQLPGITVEHSTLSEQTGCFIVIGSNILSNPEYATRVEAALKDSFYLVSRESLSIKLTSIKPPVGFDIIAILPTDSNELLVLLKKIEKRSLDQVACVRVSDKDTSFKWVREAQDLLGKTPILLVAEKEKFNGILGLINCLRAEPNGDSIRCVFIDDEKAPKFDLSNPFYAKQLELGLITNVYRNGQWGGYHHLQLVPDTTQSPSTDHIYGNIINRGDLSSLHWFQGPLREEERTIKVVYSALNFRDIMFATNRLSADIFGEGRLSQSCVLGFEYSGIEKATNRAVLGMAVKSCVASYVDCPKKFLWYAPKNWSLREAATVPVVYITVYYAFFVCVNIRKGKSILIHAGSGGVGLAAIRVAQAYGLEVYTTVSTPEKKKFLLGLFPKLKESNIGNSRDTSFEDMIQEQTDGKGVDFVLNSLAEDKLLASVRCLGQGGKFLEIGKFDMASDNKLGLGDFLNELSFHAVLADNLFKADDSIMQEIRTLIDKDIERGIVQPLPSTVFPAHEIEQAFRHLIGGKHIGKCLIQVRPEGTSEKTMPVNVLPQVYFDRDLVYVIPGGLGGFGLELADWMILREARKIVLSSSRGISNDYQSYRIALWKTYGCEIVISTADISKRSGCEQLIQEASKIGPIGGIFNLAVSLQDAIFTNQSVEKFQASFNPKAVATAHLDDLSRKHCPKLKHFVIFSSVSCGRGNAGQSNYGMANSVMERIVEDRVRNGYPGKAIQWGAIGEVGLVAIMAEDKIDLEIGGTLQQRISSCIHELDTLLSCSDPVVACMVVAEKRIGREQKMNLIESVMNIMNIKDLQTISLGATISEMGMDSLMSVELKQTLERDFDLVLSPQELRLITFQKLIEYNEKGTTISSGKADDSTIDLGFIFRNLGDENNAAYLLLPTNKQDSGNRNGSIIIPGIEGVSGETLLQLGSQLNFPASVLQYYKALKCGSSKEIAESVIEPIRSSLSKDKKYFLIAHSFGSLVTLHVASLLEKSGYSGNIVMLDGAPSLLKFYTQRHFEGTSTDEDLQNAVFAQVVANIFQQGKYRDILKQFQSQPTYEKKVECCQKYVGSQSVYSAQFAEDVMAGVTKRIKISFNDKTFESMAKINANILLVKPTLTFADILPKDYDLSKYTNGAVNIRTLDGDHTSILTNPKLPAIINEFASLNA